MKALVYSGDWGHAKRGVMWGGNQISDEWGKGEFVFERSRVRISGGSIVCGTRPMDQVIRVKVTGAL